MSQESAQASFTKTLDTSALEPTRGTIFAGRYEIIEELGAGGMGRVYRAHDTKLNEEVALKLIKAEFAAEKRIVERFRNEIKLARKITHKNVCRMHDLHEEGKTLFLTMEYVRGEDLKSFIHRSKALTVGTAVSVARQVAEGLAEAHKVGITHRDLKPGNIMIDKDGQAKIMDFGIARVRQEKGVTGEGAIVGTPEYMSPEQVEGKPADARSDIYALGVILFEMVVGCPPFEGETPFSIANKHKTEPPPVPKKLLPQLPEALNKLILRCLEKDRSKRYQTAEELATDLTDIEKALPVTERALTRAKTKIRTSREITVKLNPRKLVIPAAVILIVAIAIIAALTVLRPARGKIDSIAVLPLSDLSIKKGEGYSVDGIHDALINELTKIPSVNIISRRNAMRYKDSAKTIPEIARELKAKGIIEGSVIQTGDKIKLTVELVDGRHERRIWGPRSFERPAAEILSLYGEVALRVAREINAQLTARDIESLSRVHKVKPQAYELYLQARSKPSDDAYSSVSMKEEIDLLQQAVKIDPNFALGYVWMAATYRDMASMGYIAEAEAFEKAREAAQKALSLNDDLSEAHAILSLILLERDWDFAGAEKEYRRAMELAPNGLAGSGILVIYLVAARRFDEALALQKRAAEANPLDPSSGAFILYTARRFDEAIADATALLELHPARWGFRGIRSSCYAKKKLCTEALAESEKILAGYAGVASDPNVLIALACNYALCGNRKKAEELTETLRKTGYIDQDPACLAVIYAALGEKDLALAALEKGFESRSASMPTWTREPMLDPLLDDPRFGAMLKKYGFER